VEVLINADAIIIERLGFTIAIRERIVAEIVLLNFFNRIIITIKIEKKVN
tara:strand:- start:219 stop:368 length:150 start_codon:yes stop_codon:yes gene_type:complete